MFQSSRYFKYLNREDVSTKLSLLASCFRITMRIIDHHILLVLWLWNVKYCFCSFAHTWVVSSWSVQPPPQIRVRSHQLIKILTGDSYTYELCIWHSIVLYPMLQNYCMFKHSKGCILNLAGPILRFWRKYVFGNVWHCTKQNPSKKSAR